MPSARESSPLLGRRISAPPGSRTSGSSAGSSAAASAAASSLVAGSAQEWGIFWRRAKSTRRRVSAESCGPMISSPIALLALQQLAALDEGGEQQVGEAAVIEEQLAQVLALDRDVADRLGDDGVEEDGLAGEQVHLAEEAGGPVADDLAAGRVGDHHLALDGSP